MGIEHLDISKIGLCKEICNHFVSGFQMCMKPDRKLLLTLAIAMESVASDIRREVANRPGAE